MSLIVFMIVGCRKDFERVRPVNLATPVSFSRQIQPIFDASCAKSGCHVEFGQSPNLSPGAAFNQLIDLGYVDPTNPEGSLLYQKITAVAKQMPPTEKLSSVQINTIYAWIKQGALNN